MEENQPIIWKKGDKFQLFGKFLMEVEQDVANRYWSMWVTKYEGNIFEIRKNIKTDFKERTSLDFDAIAKSCDGITKGKFFPEFATIESLMLFVHRINELYDKSITAINENRPTPMSDMSKPTPTGEFDITYRGDSKSQNPLWWYLDIDILGERKKQQEKTNDSTITTTKKTKDYETELQDKGTSLSRGDLSEGHQLRSRKNKARIVCGHLGDKTKDC